MSQGITVINIANITECINSDIGYVDDEMLISPGEFEDLHDWIIKEALQKVLTVTVNGRVRGHHRHDVYKCMYSSVGYFAEVQLNQTFINHGLVFNDREVIKVLVLYNQLFIVRNT